MSPTLTAGGDAIVIDAFCSCRRPCSVAHTRSPFCTLVMQKMSRQQQAMIPPPIKLQEELPYVALS